MHLVTAGYFCTQQKFIDLCFELGIETMDFVANESAYNFTHSRKQLIYALKFVWDPWD
jgi:hypothetical protein